MSRRYFDSITILAIAVGLGLGLSSYWIMMHSL